MVGVALGREVDAYCTLLPSILDLPSSRLTARDAYCTVDEGGRKKRAVLDTYTWFYIPHPPLDFAALVHFMEEAPSGITRPRVGLERNQAMCVDSR